MADKGGEWAVRFGTEVGNLAEPRELGGIVATNPGNPFAIIVATIATSRMSRRAIRIFAVEGANGRGSLRARINFADFRIVKVLLQLSGGVRWAKGWFTRLGSVITA